jgi:hypothetical protein
MRKRKTDLRVFSGQCDALTVSRLFATRAAGVGLVGRAGRIPDRGHGLTTGVGRARLPRTPHWVREIIISYFSEMRRPSGATLSTRSR